MVIKGITRLTKPIKNISKFFHHQCYYNKELLLHLNESPFNPISN